MKLEQYPKKKKYRMLALLLSLLLVSICSCGEVSTTRQNGEKVAGTRKTATEAGGESGILTTGSMKSIRDGTGDLIGSLPTAGTGETTGTQKKPEPVQPEHDTNGSSLSKRATMGLEESFLEAVDQFSARTVSALYQEADGNQVYSPVSLYIALSMLAAGSDGDTKAELTELLDTADQSLVWLSGQSSRFLQQMTLQKGDCNLTFANSLWLDARYPFKEAYKQTMTDRYFAPLNSVDDFASPSTAEAVRKWVSESTGGKINQFQFEPTDQTVMLLLSALDYSDQWLSPFGVYSTEERTFHKADGSAMRANFMQQTIPQHVYAQGNGYISSRLDTQLGSVTFILPDEDVTPQSLISTPEKMKELLSLSFRDRAEVTFKIPKFSYDAKLPLDEILRSLGVQKSYSSEEADFSGISPTGTLFVQSIWQDATVAIHEQGIQAAAVTAIMAGDSAMPPEDTKKITIDCNRPFIWIAECNDVPVFVGICAEPTPA